MQDPFEPLIIVKRALGQSLAQHLDPTVQPQTPLYQAVNTQAYRAFLEAYQEVAAHPKQPVNSMLVDNPSILAVNSKEAARLAEQGRIQSPTFEEIVIRAHGAAELADIHVRGLPNFNQVYTKKLAEQIKAGSPQ